MVIQDISTKGAGVKVPYLSKLPENSSKSSKIEHSFVLYHSAFAKKTERDQHPLLVANFCR